VTVGWLGERDDDGGGVGSLECDGDDERTGLGPLEVDWTVAR
jgi:hypothetical protein